MGRSLRAWSIQSEASSACRRAARKTYGPVVLA